MVAATASRKRKAQKKGGSTSGAHGATGPTDGDLIPIGDTCVADDNCAIPAGLDHGVCGWDDSNRYLEDRAIPVHPVCCLSSDDGVGSWTCQSGQPDALCVETSDCVVPPGLEHGVCRDDICQSGKSGSSCGQTSDCVPIAELNHAVCRRGKCQRLVKYIVYNVIIETLYCVWLCFLLRMYYYYHFISNIARLFFILLIHRGVKGDYCGQDSDCLSNDCRGLGDTAKCHK